MINFGIRKIEVDRDALFGYATITFEDSTHMDIMTWLIHTLRDEGWFPIDRNYILKEMCK